jgi:O-antigen/teichoic acid export membrane protein
MTDTSSNNKRIAKNTVLLSIRMLFMMLVGLYTSRVVLNTLGVEDFGIYNVVGGIVAMFGFINSAMANGTQRYITFELGRMNFTQLQKVFCTSMNIHILISLLIIILAETIGLWFFYHKMTIPLDRINAALYVYQFSILSSVVMIMSVPYNATIIAHEKMSAFAYISVLEVILKLLVVYLLLLPKDFDRLAIYSFLIFCVQLIIRFTYVFYCKRHFPEVHYHFLWDKKLFKEMTGFAGWNLWGNCAGVASTQGLNILLNIFFGPAVNTARGIAVQVQTAISQFSNNFQMAINPQITKSYASNNYDYMHSLIFKSSKFTYFILLFLSLPVMIEAEIILSIWLKIVPEYTVVFLRLVLCITIIDAVANPLMISATATRKVKLYQSVVGGLLLFILPISYLVLKLGGNPSSVFTVHLCICIIAFIVRLFIIRPMIKLPLSTYVHQVILKCLMVTVIAIILPLSLKKILPESLYTLIIICFVCSVSILCAAYWIGLNRSERLFVHNKAIAVMAKFKL